MDATASSSRREREGIISCLWQHSAIAFRSRGFFMGCATARFHLAGRGELLGATLGKYEIRAVDSRPAARGSRRLAHSCVCLLRSGGRDLVPGLPCGSLRVGAYGGVWRLSLDRSACGQDGSGAGILGNILGPNRGMPLSTVGEGVRTRQAHKIFNPCCCAEIVHESIFSSSVRPGLHAQSLGNPRC